MKLCRFGFNKYNIHLNEEFAQCHNSDWVFSHAVSLFTIIKFYIRKEV